MLGLTLIFRSMIDAAGCLGDAFGTAELLVRLFREAEAAGVSDLDSLWAALEPGRRRSGRRRGRRARKRASRAPEPPPLLLDLTAPHSLSKRQGPAGFLNQCYRHAQGTTIYGGTSEVHRSMIAERALGLPRTRA